MRTAKTNTKENPAIVSQIPTVPLDDNLSGLVLAGNVVYRTKRLIQGDKQTEIVTYTISDDKNHQYFVDDFAPSNYFEIGQHVQLSVYIKPYIKKTGGASYSLSILKPFQSAKGDAF